MSGVKFLSAFHTGGTPGKMYIPTYLGNSLPAGFRREFYASDGEYYGSACSYYSQILRENNVAKLDQGYTTWFTSVNLIYEEAGGFFMFPNVVYQKDWYVQIDAHRRIEISENNVLIYKYDGVELFSGTFTGEYGCNTLPWYYPEFNDEKLANFGIRTAMPISEEYYYLIVADRDNNNPHEVNINNRALSHTIKENLELFFNDIQYFEPTEEDPFEEGGISEEGGGGGNFSEDSDTVEADDLPSVSAVGTGFATLFTPSRGELRDLSRLFWNADVFSFLQNLVENITQMFTSLAIVPFVVTPGSRVSVTWLGIDTAVMLTLASKQIFEFDMGSINLANDSRIFTSNSVLDYSPFSKLGIYLPFIGYRDLDIDECRNSVIKLRYRVDILSGTCVAIISLNGNDIYQFTGNCLSQIPITNENMTSLLSTVTNVAIAGANAYNAGVASQAGLDELGSKATDADRARAHMMVANKEAHLSSASANAVISGKPTFEKTGSVSASASLLSIKQPYLFLTTPRQSLPANYNRYRGYPSNITATLGSLSGFTVVDDIRLNDLVATSDEVAEIYELLKKGVII